MKKNLFQLQTLLVAALGGATIVLACTGHGDRDVPLCLESCTGECGMGVNGEWDNECVNGLLRHERVSAICDERTKTCVRSLNEDCEHGFCRIAAGSWQTGGFRSRGLPIVLTRDFEIGQTEVTVGEWLGTMGGESPSRNSCGNDCPVVGITFFDALAFANRRSTVAGLEECYRLEDCVVPTIGFGRLCNTARFVGPDCGGFRLPSEWEWELAANAGDGHCIWGEEADPCVGCLHSDYSCSAWTERYPNLQAWYCGNSVVEYNGCVQRNEGETCLGPQPVAQLRPNVFGVFDMHGNVAEFTGTAYIGQMDSPPPMPLPSGVQLDPGFDTEIVVDFFSRSQDEPLRGQGVITRGGSFLSPLQGVCGWVQGLAYVGAPGPEFFHVGLRLVRTTR